MTSAAMFPFPLNEARGERHSPPAQGPLQETDAWAGKIKSNEFKDTVEASFTFGSRFLSLPLETDPGEHVEEETPRRTFRDDF